MLHERHVPGYSRAVPSPKDKPLKSGSPKSFADHVAPSRHITGKPAPEIDGMDGAWMSLRGGQLPVPILVRIDPAPDGRFIVTGLVIGFRERNEITADTLRQIKLASVLAELFKDFDAMNPAAAEGASWERPVDLLALWQMHRWELPDVPVESRRRRHAAPNLREVAQVYLRHLAAKPHRATTETAKELHCSRATMIRRVAEAREAGLLPPKESKK
jgi:hypothetical protein